MSELRAVYQTLTTQKFIYHTQHVRGAELLAMAATLDNDFKWSMSGVGNMHSQLSKAHVLGAACKEGGCGLHLPSALLRAEHTTAVLARTNATGVEQHLQLARMAAYCRYGQEGWCGKLPGKGSQKIEVHAARALAQSAAL